MTTWQVAEGLIAVPAFAPVTVCPGYLIGWISNFHEFRRRRLIERIFWCVPLSFASSTIAAILLGKVISLTAAVVFFALCAVGAVAMLAQERHQLKATGKKWSIGWRPFGTRAIIIAVIWSVVAILLLVDFQKGENLYPSATIFDHSMRVSWIESVMRTGVPPMNPLYMDQRPAPMRYYYFWYVLCAVIAKMWNLSARAVMMASCVWAGFAVVALAGLYTKHFLEAGERTRSQVLRVCGLLAVTGLGVIVNVWSILHHSRQLPGDLEIWRAGQVTSWLNSMLWVPHHVTSMVCCMTGFLVVWLAWRNQRQRTAAIGIAGGAFASAFGLSVYVAFAFFLVALAWVGWQVMTGKKLEPGVLLGAAGVLAAVMLLPYLHELTQGSSDVQGGSVFALAIRETIPPERLLETGSLQAVGRQHPQIARNLANLILLVPGYAAELGFYFVVLLIVLIPGWRDRKPLALSHKSLVCISIATLVFISFIRSSVIESNDFGWRGALLMQFALLLLASDVMAGWPSGRRTQQPAPKLEGVIRGTPAWVRAVASCAIIFGGLTTIYQAALVRFAIPLHELQLRMSHNAVAGRLPHKMYISAIGYAKLNAAIPPEAVVQYNPQTLDAFWLNADWLGVGRQSVIDSEVGGGGSEFGGDPRGYDPMESALDGLYRGASAEEARADCHLYGIDYLVARIYDPAWSHPNGWVWKLKPVVDDDGFRTVDCR